MTECTSYNVISEYLPERIKRAFLAVKQSEREPISELRLNSGKAVALISPDQVKYLTTSGLTANPRNTAAITVCPVDISDTVEALSHYSIHSCTRELREGVFVLKNGIRVGLSGRFTDEGWLTDITGLNFRISRNISGCSEKIFDLAFRENCGILICGGVNSGKTTILRDFCRLMGERKKISLIDERNEIASTHDGVIENNVGTLTNILTGCTRSKGIISAVRTLSPDYIFCDEISTEGDINAILESLGCGVKFCASVHGNDLEDLWKRPGIKKLLESGAFRYAVILEGSEMPGKIREIRRISNDF